jgi:adenylate kinase family enzyme
MAGPRRILIIGPSGAGKSTLARAIGQRLAIPVVHLDAINWGPGWVQRDKHVMREEIAVWAERDAWVMDGNYTQTLDLRLPRTHAVIWLDLPRHVYFSRALWRSIRTTGQMREDVGNVERFELAFFTDWVWTYPKRRAEHAKLMVNLPGGVSRITLKSRREVAAFVRALPQSLDAEPVAGAGG